MYIARILPAAGDPNSIDGWGLIVCLDAGLYFWSDSLSSLHLWVGLWSQDAASDLFQRLSDWRNHRQSLLRLNHRTEGQTVGNCIINPSDGCGTVLVNSGRQRDTVFTGSLPVQFWIQRILQCLPAYTLISHEWNIQSIHSHGLVDWLGKWPNYNRIDLQFRV